MKKNNIIMRDGSSLGNDISTSECLILHHCFTNHCRSHFHVGVYGLWCRGWKQGIEVSGAVEVEV